MADPLNSVWPGDVYAKLDVLEGYAASAKNLAGAFGRTGNVAVECELQALASDMMLISISIRQHVANKVDGDFRAAEQASANILDAALAGAKSAYLDERRRELGSDKNG